MQNFVHSDWCGGTSVFESLDMDAIDVFECILSERDGLALTGHTQFQKGRVDLNDINQQVSSAPLRKTYRCRTHRDHRVRYLACRRVLRVSGRKAVVVAVFEDSARHHLVLDDQLDGAVVERQRQLHLSL